MSLGVAGAKEMNPADQEAFFEVADAGLYLAKRRGRNRVVIADPIDRENLLREAME